MKKEKTINILEVSDFSLATISDNSKGFIKNYAIYKVNGREEEKGHTLLPKI